MLWLPNKNIWGSKILDALKSKSQHQVVAETKSNIACSIRKEIQMSLKFYLTASSSLKAVLEIELLSFDMFFRHGVKIIKTAL